MTLPSKYTRALTFCEFLSPQDAHALEAVGATRKNRVVHGEVQRVVADALGSAVEQRLYRARQRGRARAVKGRAALVFIRVGVIERERERECVCVVP